MITELTVNKEKLIDILRANKTVHEATYKEAVIEYRKQAAKELTKQVNNIEAGRKFTLTFSLPKPLNYGNQYQKIIGMLELCTETHVKLSDSEYTQYVLDNWNWKQAFIGSTMSYTNSTGEGADADDEV